MTLITEGMTPTQYWTAMTNNFASAGFMNTPHRLDNSLPSWEYFTFMLLNGLDVSELQAGQKGDSFLSKINNSINDLSSADITLVGFTDVKTAGATGDGATDDEAAINAAVAAGNIIIQNGTFRLTASIKIPSNRTIYLRNCRIKMGNATYDNFFRNSDFAGGNSNISIIGLGSVILDGNAVNNNDGYVTHGPIDYLLPCLHPNIYKYNAFMFYNVTNFHISGLYIYDFMHWCICIQKSNTGIIHDIYFNHNTTLLNQDCLDIYRSHDIEMYNLFGTGTDDFVCLNAGDVIGLNIASIDGWDEGDTYNIYYHQIDDYDSTFGSLCAAVAGDGGKMYNIRVEDGRVRIGGSIFASAYNAYVAEQPLKTDFHDIIIKNCIHDIGSDSQSWPGGSIAFGQNMMDFSATGIINNTGYLDFKCRAGDQSDNVKVNGVQVT